jgi:hypothetical protein
LLDKPDTLELVLVYYGVKEPAIRNAILNLTKSLASSRAGGLSTHHSNNGEVCGHLELASQDSLRANRRSVAG